MSDLTNKLAKLQALSPAQTRSEWHRLFRREVPEHSPHLLKRSIAWKLQARIEGDLSPSVRRALDRMAQASDGDQNALPEICNELAVGTKLIRDWHGRTIEVLVTDQGFEHAGRHYRSLSQIARHVTGAHWSGPRFFGLVKRSQYNRPCSNDQT